LEYDTQQFESIYSEMRPKLISFFCDSGTQREDAEDLSESTMTRAYRHWSCLESTAKAKGWIFSIARNELRNFWRSKQARKRNADLVPYDPVDEHVTNQEEPNPADVLIAREDADFARRCLETLPEKMGWAFSLRVDEELSDLHIAKRLQMNHATVRSHLSQARKRMIECLERLRKGRKGGVRG